MKNNTIGVIVFVLLTYSGSTYADETPTVVQAYACNYLDGKGPNDLDKAITYWQSNLKGIDSPDLQNHLSGVMMPIVSSSEADFFWLVWQANLNQFARSTTAYASSKGGQASDARFQKMSRCTSNLWYAKQIHQGMASDPTDNDATAVTYACTLNKGKSMADVEAAEKLWTETLASRTPALVMRLTPGIANTPLDLAYLVFHDDLVAFGKTTSSLYSTAGTEPANIAFQEAMDCETGLYSARVVHRPPPAPAQ